jgi:hypothetical protein
VLYETLHMRRIADRLPEMGKETSHVIRRVNKKLSIAALVLAVIGVGAFFCYRNFLSEDSRQIDSIAALP